jgi:hypothetical protein
MNVTYPEKFNIPVLAGFNLLAVTQ